MNNSTESQAGEKLADNRKQYQQKINIYIYAFSRRFYPKAIYYRAT